MGSTQEAAEIIPKKPVKTDARMILDIIRTDGTVVKDYDAVLKEVAPDHFVAETRYNAPDDMIERAEGIFSAGRLMQPFPLAGTFVTKYKSGTPGRFCYEFSFGGISYYALKYIHIKSPRKGAGRPAKSSHVSSARRVSNGKK